MQGQKSYLVKKSFDLLVKDFCYEHDRNMCEHERGYFSDRSTYKTLRFRILSHLILTRIPSTIFLSFLRGKNQITCVRNIHGTRWNVL